MRGLRQKYIEYLIILRRHINFPNHSQILTNVYKFIPYGATLTNLWVKDRQGTFQDVVLGYDNKSFYRQYSNANNC